MVLSRWSVSVKRSILFGCCDIYVMMGYICVIPAGINSCVWTDTCELYLDTEQVARGEKKTVVGRRKLNSRNTEKSVNTVSTFDCIARSVFLGLQMDTAYRISWKLILQ